MSCSSCQRDRKVVARGLCNACYQRARKYGEPIYKRNFERPPCQVCGEPSVSRKLCQKHYMRWRRHGSTDQTRPEDWGEKDGHPLYESWKWTSRTKEGRVSEWDDFWKFVNDVQKRPSPDHRLRRRNPRQPFGPNNCYWDESTSSADKTAYMREWRRKNPVREKSSYLKRSFGITIEEYNEILDQQDGKCAICFKHEHVLDKNGKRRALAVDHCHNSKKIRGLLCTNCNKGIGHLKDSIELLESAITYLKKFT